MTMQNNIDILRRIFRRNMHQPKSQTVALKIDNQRPVFIPITIPPDNKEWQADRFQIKSDRRLADVAKMPDLIRIGREIENFLRQLVMRIGQNKNLHSTESRTTDTTGTKIATANFVVTFAAFVRGLI